MGHIKQQVALIDARFFAYHGYYPEEQVLGNEFKVDIQVAFAKHTESADELENTVNYQTLHTIAKDEMQHPRKLLETVAESMLHRIVADFPFVEEVDVTIHKSHPPFGSDAAKAAITLTWKA